MQQLPAGPAALHAVLEVNECDRARPCWIGMQDERDLRDPDAQYAVHRRLVATARAAGPLRIVLARVAAIFLGSEAWKRIGFVRLSDYARERLGISSRDLQELGRVGAKLGCLSALEAAFASGQLCWSKVRLIARVATPSDEGSWIERAEGMTTRTLAKEIRVLEAQASASNAEPTDDEELHGDFFQLACSAQARRQWYRIRRLAHRVAGHRVSAAECIEMLTAEVRSAIPLGPDAPDNAPNRRGSSWSRELEASRWPTRFAEDVPRTCHGVDELPERADELLPELAESLRLLVDRLEDVDPWELDQRLRTCLQREQRLESQVGALLSIVSKKGIHRAYEFPSASRYAEELLGFSQRKAQMLLRIERAAQGCPPLALAYRSGEISWVQADLLAPLVFADSLGRWWEYWIEWAKRVTVRQLRDDVEHARMIRDTEPETWRRTGGLPGEVGASAAEEGLSSGAKTCASSSIGFSAEAELVQAFYATLWTVRKRIERVTGVFPPEGEAFEAMMEHVHHVVRRSQGGGDEESNLVTLCAAHHHRGVHGGTVEITGKAPDDLVFKLGVRPDGPPLAVYRSGDRLVG